mmetsp:Transcript_10873/g.18249  ORF Transcript_10873/g.18249 Transcript_10873/m.18249 type:complete len:308 (+) Transcript_10873:123-1046(+)
MLMHVCAHAWLRSNESSSPDIVEQNESPLQVSNGLTRDIGYLCFRSFRYVVVLTLGCCCDLLRQARRHELVLRVKHEQLEVRQHAQHLGSRKHLLLDGSLIDRLVSRLTDTCAQGHVGPPIRDADNKDFADIAGLLRIQPSLGCLVQSVSKRRAATAGHALKAILRHGYRSGRRQQHLRKIPLEGDEADLITAFVGFGKKVDSSALCSVHTIERHRSRRVNDKDDQRACFSRHLLGADVRLLDIYALQLATVSRCSGVVLGFLTPLALVRSCCAHCCIDCELADTAFGNKRLNVSPALLGEYHATRT